ncbi:MAG: rRNA large subunit methyltransferase I [Elusimicrobia bacterium]|nr:MAG: rRNA large subunit methyltransferase I [Elusimicrobiota bacterium]
MSDELIALKLKPGEEDRLQAGHRWIFSNELSEIPEAAPGALAVLQSSRNKTLGIGFYNPKSLIAFRLLAREPAPINAEFLRDRLEAALNRRKRYLGEEATAYRLCFGESDELPGLIADRFGDVIVLQVLSAGIQNLIEPLVEALRGLLDPVAIYQKNDHPSRQLEGLSGKSGAIFGELPAEMVIEENGLKFAVDPVGAQKTGFYFDQRENRMAITPFVKGKCVLDLYCHSGAFALNAAKHGAIRVFGIDSSERAIESAVTSAKLNGLEGKCDFRVGDAEKMLADFSATRQNFQPDVVFVDPPSLVPSKKHLTKALRAYVKINANAFRLLRRGGIVATSTCSNHISRQAFMGILREAASKAQKTVRLLEMRGAAKDHPTLITMPETEYLHFALLEIG